MFSIRKAVFGGGGLWILTGNNTTAFQSGNKYSKYLRVSPVLEHITCPVVSNGTNNQKLLTWDVLQGQGKLETLSELANNSTARVVY